MSHGGRCVSPVPLLIKPLGHGWQHANVIFFFAEEHIRSVPQHIRSTTCVLAFLRILSRMQLYHHVAGVLVHGTCALRGFIFFFLSSTIIIHYRTLGQKKYWGNLLHLKRSGSAGGRVNENCRTAMPSESVRCSGSPQHFFFGWKKKTLWSV